MKYLQYDQVDNTNDEFLTRLWFVFVFVINVLITHNFNKDCGYDFNSPNAFVRNRSVIDGNEIMYT